MDVECVLCYKGVNTTISSRGDTRAVRNSMPLLQARSHFRHQCCRQAFLQPLFIMPLAWIQLRWRLCLSHCTGRAPCAWSACTSSPLRAYVCGCDFDYGMAGNDHNIWSICWQHAIPSQHQFGRRAVGDSR